jgi:4-alpha-glucanotransferase
LLVSPDLLIEDGLLDPSECDEGRRLPKSEVDFDAVIAFKHRLLDLAWSNFASDPRPQLRAPSSNSVWSRAHWLEDYALFRA